MSYSNEVKNELCSMEVTRECCSVSEICGIIRLIGQYRYDGDVLKQIIVMTENKKIAERFSMGLRNYYGIDAFINRKANSRGGKTSFEIVLEAGDLSDEITKDFDSVIPELYKFKGSKSGKCCLKSFLRGAFLASGSITDPKKTYHLELHCHTEETAGILYAIMDDFELNPKIVLRKGSFVVYIKDAEFISDFLKLTGAHKSLMDFENIRIEKEMRNNVNRAVNCETANIQKTLDASFRQIETIKYIKEITGLVALPENLRQLAILRLDNPELSLSEIGFLLYPPLGKSGVSHRMKKIIAYAEELKKLKEG